MWKSFIKENVVKPGLRRIGTMGAGVLLFGGDWLCTHANACGLVTQGGAEVVMTYVTAVALVGYDLAASYFERHNKAKRP